MSYVHVRHRIVPVRSRIPNQLINTRVPIHYQHPTRIRHNPPRHLPVLHAPTFPRGYGFYEQEEEEEEEQQQQQFYGYPTTTIADQHGTYMQTLSSTYNLFQNYTQQQLTRSIISNYPSYIYYNY